MTWTRPTSALRCRIVNQASHRNYEQLMQASMQAALTFNRLGHTRLTLNYSKLHKLITTSSLTTVGSKSLSSMALTQPTINGGMKALSLTLRLFTTTLEIYRISNSILPHQRWDDGLYNQLRFTVNLSMASKPQTQLWIVRLMK